MAVYTPHPSIIKRNEAEAEKHRAERNLFAAQAREAEADAAQAEIELAKARRSEDRMAAQNEYHKVYVFDESVTDDSVSDCMGQLTIWSRNEPGCEIEIQINSPGGEIFEGFALIDFIRGLREQGHKITMVAYGMAASMGGVLLQAGDVRVMGENALMLIHEGSLVAFGDFGQVEDRMKLMKLMHKKILKLFTERATVGEQFIKNRWERKDWWLTAEDCLDHGFIDEIR